jgi:hypothetical protein
MGEDKNGELVKRLKKHHVGSYTSFCDTIYYLPELLDFRDREWLNDVCIMCGLLDIKRKNLAVKVQVMRPTILGSMTPGHCPKNMTDIIQALEKEHFKCENGVTILPVNIANNHWVCILVDWRDKVIWKFDPYHRVETYTFLAQIIKKLIYPMLPHRFMEAKSKGNLKQKDSVNCGMFVLLFVESYLTGKIPHVSKVALEKARFRYFKSIMDIDAVIEV